MARHFTNHATKNFKRWSKSEDSKLKTMIVNGFNSEEIALELGRTRASIMGRKSFLGIEERLEPARGSKMPYTSFARNRHNDSNQAVMNFPEVIEKPVEKKEKSSLGSSLDEVIAKAKAMGLKVNITISSEM